VKPSIGEPLSGLIHIDLPEGIRAYVGTCEQGYDWPVASSSIANEVELLVNAHRKSIGKGELGRNSALDDAAIWKARHMARYGYMAHADTAPPWERATRDRIAACGYAGWTWGENIAMGYRSASTVVNAWLGSPGHRANIEGSGYSASGLGVAQAANGYMYWAQCFGVGATQPKPPVPEPPGFGLTVSGRKLLFGRHELTLQWQNAKGPMVAVWRDGRYVMSTANDGQLKYRGANVPTTYRFKLRDGEGRSSNEVTFTLR
jgi:hypothetical protein